MKKPNRINYAIKLARDSRKALELGEIVYICNIRQDSIKALDNEIATRNMQIKKDIGISYTVYQQRRKQNEKSTPTTRIPHKKMVEQANHIKNGNLRNTNISIYNHHN